MSKSAEFWMVSASDFQSPLILRAATTDSSSGVSTLRTDAISIL
ncbi:hypothetical protein SANTM175S_05639 [Streptomyces antimycoticus]